MSCRTRNWVRTLANNRKGIATIVPAVSVYQIQSPSALLFAAVICLSRVINVAMMFQKFWHDLSHLHGSGDHRQTNHVVLQSGAPSWSTREYQRIPWCAPRSMVNEAIRQLRQTYFATSLKWWLTRSRLSITVRMTTLTDSARTLPSITMIKNKRICHFEWFGWIRRVSRLILPMLTWISALKTANRLLLNLRTFCNSLLEERVVA